jgi:PKD repeat protein
MRTQLAIGLAVHVFAALLFSSLGSLCAQDSRIEHGFAGIKLAKPLTRGQDIPASLGSRFAEVAKAYGHTEKELRDICSRDRNSLHVDADARLLYVCRALPGAQKAGTASAADVITQPSYPLEDTFFLSSNLNASKTIYLDFTGHTTTGTVWNSSSTGGEPIVTPPYDTDGDPSSFSDTELANIQSIWKRVAEDYAPFEVNVTTLKPPLEELRKTSKADIFYGIRVVIGGDSTWLGDFAGGVAYLNSFNWSSDTPAFVFPQELANGNPKYVAEAASHEAGHSFGLSHDGTSFEEYYEGNSNWAPIMGVSYDRDITQWSKGEYPGANNTEDDTAIIALEVPYRTDVHGDSMAAATILTGPDLSAQGIIGTREDVDYFKVTSGTGAATFTVTPDNVSPNLDVQLRLFNSAGALIASANPETLDATITTTLAQGSYYLEVDGVGNGSDGMGYTDYASLGQYRISGTIPVPGGIPPIAVANHSAPLTGAAPLAVTFSSAGSSDPDGSITTYSWLFGDGGSGSGQTVSHTYTVAGTYTATLTVKDNSGLTGTATVSVVATGPSPRVVAVGNIVMSWYRNYFEYYVGAKITIKDQDGIVVTNATVKGTWSGLVSGTFSGKTNSSGVVQFYSPTSHSRGTYTVTVTNVELPKYSYDASKNKKTSDSLSRP